MATQAMALQNRLQSLSSDFQKIQSDLSDAVEAQQRLDAQLQENDLVKKVRAVRLMHSLRVMLS